MDRPFPPIFFLLSLIFLAMLDYTVPIIKFTYYTYTLPIALMLFIVSLTLGLSAVFLFIKSGTTFLPGRASTVLVINGPYRLSRNPMYLSMFIFLLGAVIGLGSLSGIVAPFIFISLINRFVLPFEEHLMEERFGKSYLEYKKRVRRWI